jgi:hypothetical protein
VLLINLSCQSEGQKVQSIDGVCFVAPRNPLVLNDLKPIQQINADWVAVVPYAFALEGEPIIHYGHERQWWGERAEGIIQTITYAKQLGLKVMLKPHVWVRGQGWPGDFTLESEAAWQQWEKSYAQYLQAMTEIADSMQVEMLCIGTEYRKAVVARPDFWRSLIDTIRSQYKGKLTYAANWDNFENVVFWDQLDFIGIDAYFPLCEDQTPDVSTLIDGWQTPLRSIKRIQRRFNKPVLFTEYGYQSADYTSRGHWHATHENASTNMEAQKNAYAALYQVFWHEPWFAGGFLWKWFAAHERAGGEADADYTPQHKPAMEVIKQVYGR